MNAWTWIIIGGFLTVVGTIILGYGWHKMPEKNSTILETANEPKKEATEKKTRPNSISTPLITSNIKPVLEIKVDSKKNLILENRGTTDLKDISVFATRYVFDENCFGKELKIKKYNKIGGSLYNIPVLERKIGKESFDLTERSFLKFYENPGGKDEYMPFVTFYCFRVTFREASAGTKHAKYCVTTAYKNFPSMIENQETTASAGTPEGDFMYKIPKVITDHQKTIFGE